MTIKRLPTARFLVLRENIHILFKMSYLMLFGYMSVSLYDMDTVCVQEHTGQEKLLDPLEVELQVVVNGPVWVLETKLGSSGRRSSTLDH